MKKIVFFIAFLISTQLSFGQFRIEFEPNYDESKVPEYELPDPLRTFKGRKIRNERRWLKKGRPELLRFFSTNVYGEVPGKLEVAAFDVMEQGNDALGGKARRKQVDVVFKKGGRTLHFNILIYLPKDLPKAPLFVGCNFFGNHTVTEDVHVMIPEAWSRNYPSFGIIHNQLTEQSRGVRTNRWPVEKILDAGFGLATIYYGEVDPDKDDFSDGIHPFFYSEGQQRPAANEWGSIGAWAWGLSRAMDYFEKDADIDAEKVIVFGHSRLGKTALWAGAQDQRFAAVISNNSGCGGAALSKRRFGETVGRINNIFPHWFCKNFRNYNQNEDALPVDQHELIALIAPRPVYIASAEEDQWADPRGEFLAAYHATPVYELFGKKGISEKAMPPLNQPVQHTVAYHIRSGGHDITDYDWEQYLQWAALHLEVSPEK